MHAFAILSIVESGPQPLLDPSRFVLHVLRLFRRNSTFLFLTLNPFSSPTFLYAIQLLSVFKGPHALSKGEGYFI